MTATALNYIVACEHISDLRREADRRRLASEVAGPHTSWRPLSRVFARRIAQPAAAVDSRALGAAHTGR